jgi:hypothetical protein
MAIHVINFLNQSGNVDEELIKKFPALIKILSSIGGWGKSILNP